MSYERNQIISLLYRIFQAEEYKWYDNNRGEKIPTFDEIEKTVETLEEKAIEFRGISETGRIKVEYDKDSQSFDYYFHLGIS
jgi:hypothetical protein